MALLYTFFRAIVASGRAAAVERQARQALRSAGLRSGRPRLGARSAELVQEAAELQQQANDTVETAFYEAISTMAAMLGNEGQASVFQTQVIPAFAEALAQSQIEQGWPDVDIGEYMVFMGEIVAEGNAIMEEAYQEAEGLLDEASDLEAELEDEEFEEEEESEDRDRQLFVN